MRTSPNFLYLRYCSLFFFLFYHTQYLFSATLSYMLPSSVCSQGPLNLLPTESRITSKEFKEIVQKKERHILLDVRPSHHYEIVSLPDSLNIPLANLESRLNELTSVLKEKEDAGDKTGSRTSLYVVCRRGNDSQRAVEYLRESGFDSAKDIVGGLEAWAAHVNPNFPTY